MTGEQLLEILNNTTESKSIPFNYFYDGKNPVDLFSVPFDTLGDVMSIPRAYRYKGMTVTVVSGSTVGEDGKPIPEEYWLVNGVKDSNWQKKPYITADKLSLSVGEESGKTTVELIYDGDVVGNVADLTDKINGKNITSGSVVTEGQVDYIYLYYDNNQDFVKIDVSSLNHGGGSQSLSASTYSDAVLLATDDNIGTIINVLNDEAISGDTYSAGLYVVTGQGSVSKLGISSATGDVEGDVENLKARVTALETLTENLYWLTDEE